VRVFGDGTPAGSARFDGIQLETGSTLTTYTDATKYLFTGYVERWPQSWERADYAYVDIQAVDGFELLANAYVTSSFPIQQTGARVAAVLDTVSWPAADRSISTGRSQIQASTFTAGSPASALEHIQSVVESELGLFFMDGEGDAVFQDRLYRGTTSTSTTSQATFGDQGAELEYTELRPTMDKQLIVNEAIVSPQGGTAQTWTDSTSQTRYFRRSRSRSSLVEDDNEALSLAQYLIWNYKDPSLRFDQLSFQPLDDDTLFTQALDRRISDRITVKRRPPGGGPVMSLDSFIESIDYSISASHIWTITWQLSPILPANTATYFQLDVSTLDGTHVLAY
jgi:hypothetical protein